MLCLWDLHSLQGVLVMWPFRRRSLPVSRYCPDILRANPDCFGIGFERRLARLSISLAPAISGEVDASYRVGPKDELKDRKPRQDNVNRCVDIRLVQCLREEKDRGNERTREGFKRALTDTGS